MKSLTETYTPLIKNLQDLNQEIRLRLSYTHCSTEQEMKSSEAWLEEVRGLVKNLENHSSIIYHHSQLLEIKLQEQRQKEATSKG